MISHSPSWSFEILHSTSLGVQVNSIAGHCITLTGVVGRLLLALGPEATAALTALLMVVAGMIVLGRAVVVLSVVVVCGVVDDVAVVVVVGGVVVLNVADSPSSSTS